MARVRTLVLAAPLALLAPTFVSAQPLPPPPPPAQAENPWGGPVVAQSPPPPVQVAAVREPPREPVTFTTRPEARHAFYVEGSTLLFTGAASVHYNWRPLRGFALSGGVGAGYATAILVGVWGFGAQVMAHGLFGGDSPHSFEVAAGASVAWASKTWFLSWSSSSSSEGNATVLPAAFLGYRYQRLTGGVVARAGAAWTVGFGIGLAGSVGFAF